MAAGSSAPTPTEYIVHHLAHLNSSGSAQKDIVDFSIINYDTVFWSVAMGLLTMLFFYSAARKVRVEGPSSKLVAMVESLVEFVHDQARSIVHGDVRMIAPLALTAFVWIVFMNAIDLIPVDLPGYIGSFFGLHYMRAVPTADLNATLAMSLVVLGASIYYGIKIKHPGGFVKELFSAPFGKGLVLAPFNFLIQLIEYAAKTVSLGMRLFGNMFAGELVFMLIALLGATATWWGFGLHFLTGLGWAIFHILIITLQGFIFMMLTLVYLGQAHEGH